jgi:hypothetical protein
MAAVQRQMAEVQRRYAEYAETDTDMQLDRETERKREWKFQNFQLTRSGPEVRPVRHLGGVGATVLQARRAGASQGSEILKADLKELRSSVSQAWLIRASGLSLSP